MGGVGSFPSRFISCSEELGLWLFGHMSWVFFWPTESFSPSPPLLCFLASSLGFYLDSWVLLLSGSPKLERTFSSSHEVSWDQDSFLETSFLWHIFVFLLKKNFIYLLLERGEGKEKERERIIHV